MSWACSLWAPRVLLRARVLHSWALQGTAPPQSFPAEQPRRMKKKEVPYRCLAACSGASPPMWVLLRAALLGAWRRFLALWMQQLYRPARGDGTESFCRLVDASRGGADGPVMSSAEGLSPASHQHLPAGWERSAKRKGISQLCRTRFFLAALSAGKAELAAWSVPSPQP